MKKSRENLALLHASTHCDVCVCVGAHAGVCWVVDILHFPHQKKKKDRRKGKDAAEEEEEKDHMLTLTRLSLQASDEEDEPGGTRSRCVQMFLLKALLSLLNVVSVSTAVASSKAKKKVGQSPKLDCHL